MRGCTERYVTSYAGYLLPLFMKRGGNRNGHTRVK